jgi:hypothetical protein
MAIWDLRKAVVAGRGLEGTSEFLDSRKMASFQCSYLKSTSAAVVKAFKERPGNQGLTFIGQAEARAQATAA